jgi:lipopolysaccharide export system permease protein
MPRILFFYLSKRIALATLLIATGLCVPVVMTTLFQYLPAAAIRGGLLMPALLGTLPTVVYLALPMAVGVAVALEFARMSADGMLEPAQFYTFDNGARTIYFRRWRSADVVSGMFIREFSAEKKEEQIITATEAEFRRNANGVVLIMSDGSIETIPADGSSIRTANFDEYALPIAMQGSGDLPQRNWRGVFELPFLEFFRERPSSGEDPRQFAEWMSEAAKRCGIPLLALIHALLAIGLVLNVASASGSASAAVKATMLAIPAIHVAILVSAETLVRQDPGFVWFVGLAIIVEFAAAIILIERQNANFTLANDAVAQAVP